VLLNEVNGAGRFAGKVTLSPTTYPDAVVVVNVTVLPVEFADTLLKVALTIPLFIAAVTAAVLVALLLLAAVTEPVKIVVVLKVVVVPNFHAH
jgi:hypothetical protein